MNEHLVGLAVFPQQSHNMHEVYDQCNVGRLIDGALQQANLGQKNPEVPLADIIQPGMTVMLKPNWVLHYNQSDQSMDCMVTHTNFILATLKRVLDCKPNRVILGDAPIQGCSWDQLVTNQLRREIERIDASDKVEIVDFRRTILREGNPVAGVETKLRDENDYVLFDLGKDSLLESISSPQGRFRVTMYDPDELARSHRPGKHQYLLCREAFEVDVILSLPKLKTHRKAGLTAALKNLVGLNGNKDYLPHHRIGGTKLGGDCYYGSAPLKRVAEYCLDIANKHINTPSYGIWASRANYFLNFHKHIFGEREIEGGWYGNDTVWRMVLDLNRILLYGKSNGSMADRPQRQIWTLTDAIVCGEGDGPLAPKPRWLGAVTFSDSSSAVDWVHAALLRLDPEKIPLLRESFGQFRWPLVITQPSAVKISFQNRKMSLLQVAEDLGITAQPPKGWVGHCELKMKMVRDLTLSKSSRLRYEDACV